MYESKTEIVIWRIRIGVGSVIRIQVHGWVPPRSRDEPRGTARIAFRLLIGSCVISNSNCFVANITCVPQYVGTIVRGAASPIGYRGSR